LQNVIKDGREIREKYKYIIFCGMGGSGLSVEVVKDTFGEPGEGKIYSLRTTDPAVIKDILDEITKREGSLKSALEKTLVIPISKSGKTQETVSHKEYFEGLFKEEGLDIKDHMWVITDKGSPMDTGRYVQRAIQLNGKGDIGGRFTSPTTRIFLLPLAIVAPERAENVLKIAEEMNDVRDINRDSFIVLGAYLYYMAAQQGKDKLTFIVPDELKALPMWAEQLFEESLGKDGKGVTVFYGEDISEDALKPADENDRVFLRVNVGGKKTNDRLWNYLREKGYPVFEINADSVDSIGGIMLGLQRAVATIGYLWDICFVDQPAVEGYKEATREVMATLKEGEEVKVPSDWAYASSGKLKIYYDRLIAAGAVTKEDIEKEVAMLGSTMNDGVAVYAAILNILRSRPVKAWVRG
jgi:glucose-6-phosphate isomerase/transaldolase/glucose-6-phosphate isomerase